MRRFDQDLQNISAVIEKEHARVLREDERKEKEEKEAGRTDGTDPKEVLEGKTRYALDFLSKMVDHGMPYATAFQVEASEGSPAYEVKGYEIGTLSAIEDREFIPYSRQTVDSRKFSVQSELEEYALHEAKPEKHIDYNARTREVLRPVFLCSDGKLRTKEGKNIIKAPGEEFISGVRFKTKHNPGFYRTYSDEQDRFYDIPLEHLLPAMAAFKIHRAQEEQEKTRELEHAEETKLRKIAKSLLGDIESQTELVKEGVEDIKNKTKKTAKKAAEKARDSSQARVKDLGAFAQGSGELDTPKIASLDLRNETETETEEMPGEDSA